MFSRFCAFFEWLKIDFRLFWLTFVDTELIDLIDVLPPLKWLTTQFPALKETKYEQSSWSKKTLEASLPILTRVI